MDSSPPPPPTEPPPLPPPLPLASLGERVKTLDATSTPTTTSVDQARAFAEAWPGGSQEVGLQATCIKNIINGLFGKHGALDWKVTMQSTVAGENDQWTLQMEFATGTQPQQRKEAQKAKVLQWCADREQWAETALSELGQPTDTDLKDYPLAKEELLQAIQDSGCSAVKAPADIGMMLQGQQGRSNSVKFLAGQEAVVQLLASCCTKPSVQAQPEVGGSAAPAAPPGCVKVDLRLLRRLLRRVLRRPPAGLPSAS